MALRDKYDPIIVIWEQEGKVEWEAWIKYDKVIMDVNSGHISCDLASTQIWSQDDLYLDLTWSTRAQCHGPHIFSWIYYIFIVFSTYFVSHVICSVHGLVMWQVTWLCYLSFLLACDCEIVLPYMYGHSWLDNKTTDIRSFLLMLCVRFYSA